METCEIWGVRWGLGRGAPRRGESQPGTLGQPVLVGVGRGPRSWPESHGAVGRDWAFYGNSALLLLVPVEPPRGPACVQALATVPVACRLVHVGKAGARGCAWGPAGLAEPMVGAVSEISKQVEMLRIGPEVVPFSLCLLNCFAVGVFKKCRSSGDGCPAR